MKIVYFGDSITEEFTLLNQLDHVVNLGISGNKINNLIGRLDDVFLEHPDRLIIMIGINDYLFGKNHWGHPFKSNIKYMYGVLLKLIHDNLPNCDVICVSILPISIDLDSSKLLAYNNDIVKYNSYIETLTKTYLYQYVDIHSKFLNPEGCLDSKYTRDGVHLNERGYQHYYTLISPFLVD